MLKWRFGRLMAVLLASAVVLAACSSTSSKKASPKAASPHAVSASSGIKSAAYKMAEERVAEFLNPPSSTLPVTTTLTVPKRPLKIAYVWCAQVVCTEIAAGIQEAAKVLGAQFLAFHQQDTASTVSTAFTNALSAHPSVVFTSGDPPQWYQSQLSQLNAEHVPVIAWSIPENYHPAGFGANLITNDDYFFQGMLEADYVAVKTHDHANVILESVPQYPVLATQSAGFNYEFPKVCPGCQETTDNFSVSQLASGANVSATVSTLQKDPKANWLVATCACEITPELSTAIDNAGFKSLKAIESDGVAVNYQMMKNHQLIAADIALAEHYLGWLAVNDALLALDGKTIPKYPPPPNTTVPGHPDVLVAGLPIQILTPSDVPNPNQVYTPIPNYKSDFEKLWGLG